MTEETELILREIGIVQTIATDCRDEQRETNGRLRRAESNISVLNWAVFGAGAAAVGYLLVLHLLK